MISLFDSHCHIQVIGHSGDDHTKKLWVSSGLSLKQVIENARANGVNELMAVGCYHEESELAISLAATDRRIYASIGIHPHESDKYAGKLDRLNKFADLASSPEVKAIGECGLDYFYMHSTKANQEELLKFQIKLAIKYNLPLIFHVREAYDDFWPIFDELNSNGLRGVLHSYTDSQENLDLALKRGLYIGVNGIATFTKDQGQLKMYKNIPINKLILETDAPYLTPSPIRGTVNEPKNVLLVAKFLAELRGETVEEIAKATTDNSRHLFGISS